MTTYTTTGKVRGCCQHRHRTIKAALDCLSRDLNYCCERGGYSDRYLVYDDLTPLSEADCAEAEQTESRRYGY